MAQGTYAEALGQYFHAYRQLPTEPLVLLCLGVTFANQVHPCLEGPALRHSSRRRAKFASPAQTVGRCAADLARVSRPHLTALDPVLALDDSRCYSRVLQASVLPRAVCNCAQNCTGSNQEGWTTGTRRTHRLVLSKRLVLNIHCLLKD